MNNLRSIKKDVIFLTNEVISDCWISLYYDKNADEVNSIINDAIALSDKLFADINNYPKGKGEAKKFFKVVRKELITGIDGFFKRINNLK